VLFASVAVWNIAIQNSSATQASLLVNLAPLWVVLSPTYSLTQNQQLILIGTTVALFGMAMLVGFKFFLN
jgi:drug/metabolite transporter (DMT)-like permease